MIEVGLLVGLGALIGGIVSGLAGFGFGLAALGLWLHVIEPSSAASLVALCSVSAHLNTVKKVWPSIDLQLVWPIVAGGVIGVPVGTLLVAMVEPSAFRQAVGVFLIGFATLLLAARSLPRVTWGGRYADGGVGFISGIFGGLAGLSGPALTLWVQFRDWGKTQQRGTFQGFNMAIMLLVLLAHIAMGLVDRTVLTMALVSVPCTLVGAAIGHRIYERADDRRYRAVVLSLILLSGLTLVLSTG